MHISAMIADAENQSRVERSGSGMECLSEESDTTKPPNWNARNNPGNAATWHLDHAACRRTPQAQPPRLPQLLAIGYTITTNIGTMSGFPLAVLQRFRFQDKPRNLCHRTAMGD